jgi:uncharacterized membrane protein YgcG
MRTAGRRRLDVVVIAIGALVGGCATAVGGAVSDQERLPQMWVGAELRDDGSSRVTEVIDYDTGLATDRHGIVRRIPGLTIETPVVVQSSDAPAGIASKTTFVFDGGEVGIEMKIGDANTTISGRHRYVITYDSDDLIVGRSLAWDAIGTGWPFRIDQAEVHVVAPWRFTDATCEVGSVGSTDPCTITQPEPGHLVATVDSLAPHNGITVRADQGALLDDAPALPAPPLTAPPDPGAGLLMPMVASIVAGLGGAASTSKLVRRAGRERVGAGGAADAAWAGAAPGSEVRMDETELAKMATTEFAPPEGITPAQGGLILTENVTNEHKVAWLIQAAVDGGIELVEEDGQAVRLLHKGTGAPADAPILATAFAGRDAIELGTYDSSFATAWGLVDEQLQSWATTSGVWDPNADRRKTRVRVLGALAALIGGAMAALGGYLCAGYGKQWLPVLVVGALLGGGGFAAAVRGWELRVRTPLGSALWLRVESFRSFLAQSEAFHAEEAAKRGVLREYTAWAVALGEIDRWQRAVAASTAIPQDAGLSYAYMAPALLHSTSSTSTAPSSSSSGGGFSGGGGVGGGGGGGGGGSW